MPQIALCITELEPGGAERALVRLAINLDRSRFTPIVYVLAPPPENRTLLGQLQAADIPVHFFNIRHLWQFPRAIRRLRRALCQDRPDVLQSFLFHANITARLAANTKKLAGIKVFSGIRVAERRHRWPLILDRLTEKHVTAHVAVSQSVAQFSISEAGLSEAKMVVIPNCVDTLVYSTASQVSPVTCDRKPANLFYIGRLDPQKNVPMLVSAMPRLSKILSEQHGIEVELFLVGSGPERAHIEQLRAELGLENHVHLLGYRDDIPKLLTEASLLVLPSRWEGMPNVVLEAMAAARPVVASRVEGIAELLGETADAQTFPIDNSDAMCDKIVAILTDSNLATHLAHSNHTRVVEHFSISQMVDRYVELWQS